MTNLQNEAIIYLYKYFINQRSLSILKKYVVKRNFCHYDIAQVS